MFRTRDLTIRNSSSAKQFEHIIYDETIIYHERKIKIKSLELAIYKSNYAQAQKCHKIKIKLSKECLARTVV